MMNALQASLFALTRGQLGHPDPRALYATVHSDREHDGPADMVSTHVAACDPCSVEIDFLRRVGEQARAMSAPPVRPALLARVHAERRRIGGGVIVRTPSVTRRGSKRLVTVAAGLAAAAIALIVAIPREGTAGAADSDLRFSVPYARAGEEVSAAYTPGGGALADSLVLRARLRHEVDGAYGVGRPNRTISVLRRGPSGSYVGSFRFPDSVVYASFVVEDASGSWVDDREKQQWQLLLVSDSKPGQPTFEALVQRSNDHMGRSWEVAFASAREAVRLYPDRADGWSTLRFFESHLLGDRYADSLRIAHLPRLRGLHAKLSTDSSMTSAAMNSQFFYAMALEDSALIRYWRDRLVRTWPASPEGVQARLRMSWESLKGDTTTSRRLSEYEKIYLDVAEAPGAFARQGFMVLRLGLDAAVASRDTAVIDRWAARYLGTANGRSDSTYVSTLLVRVPKMRAVHLERLREFARGSVEAGMNSRPLGWTVAAWRAELTRRRADLHASIGRALVASGEMRAGADSLERAALVGWSVPLFREASAAWFKAGDSARAWHDMARLAVDPSTSAAAADSLARAAGRPAQWSAWTTAARAEMRAIILAEGFRKPLRGDPKVLSLDGSEVSLASLVKGRPTVVTFWARGCAPSLDELPAVEKLWQELRARGINLVAITDEPPSRELRGFLAEKRLTIPVYLDARGAATKALDNFGTPNYFILDPKGVVRFDQRELSTVVRNATLLLPEAHSTS